jgi:hypothetical protein
LTLLTRCEISENEANNHRECTVAVVVTGSPPNLGGVPGGDRGIVKQGSNLWKTDIGKGRNL